MEPVKIGRYVADRRKALGLTQKQLAEKLGMSDKSVSKWERGICLPDVSVYSELCEILGISINEFLAGEDIREENILRKSEENIIDVATDSKRRQRRLKLLVFLMLAVSMTALLLFGAILFRANRPQNFIAAVSRDSVEMKTAELLSGMDGAFLYKYTADDEYASLRMYCSRYHSGELVRKDEMEISHDGMEASHGGTILIVPDFKNFTVKLIIADESSKLSTEIPILEDVEGRQYYGRSATQIDGNVDIRYNEEQELLALIYDNDKMRVIDIGELMDGKTGSLSENDYVYFFSFQFCK